MTTQKDDPKKIDTYKKVIDEIKRDLHTYVAHPNNENASLLYSSIGSLPFKYKEYDYWNDTDRICEARDYMSMLFQLFDDYFQMFIKEGLRIDHIIKEEHKDE